MSSHSSKSLKSDVKSLKSLLKQLSKDIQSISSKQLENETKTNELTKEKDEKSRISKKLPSHASISKDHNSFGEGSLRINYYYQASPRRHRRDRREQESPREVRVDQPHFHGKENVEACLDWEMRVEKLFASHKVKKERKIQKKREEDEREAKEKEKEKPSEGWCESRKNEEYLITPLTSILKIENQEKTLEKQKAREKSVPSHKVLQQERKFENTFENMLLVEQPSLTFCKGTLASLIKKRRILERGLYR